jgi:hypothetical protein
LLDKKIRRGDGGRSVEDVARRDLDEDHDLVDDEDGVNRRDAAEPDPGKPFPAREPGERAREPDDHAHFSDGEPWGARLEQVAHQRVGLHVSAHGLHDDDRRDGIEGVQDDDEQKGPQDRLDARRRPGRTGIRACHGFSPLRKACLYDDRICEKVNRGQVPFPQEAGG